MLVGHGPRYMGEHRILKTSSVTSQFVRHMNGNNFMVVG